MSLHVTVGSLGYFGYDPDWTVEEVRDRLLKYETGDNRITELSRAYRIELGTGWYIPPAIVHAPRSVLTYEPQWNSDVNCVHENIVAGEIYGYGYLAEGSPPDKKRDIDYILSLMDWSKNVDPHFKRKYFRPHLPSRKSAPGVDEKWITYGNEYFSAKEISILPGASITLCEPMPCGCIAIQGHGRFGVFPVESATMLRFGQPSADEFFVGEEAAKNGILIANHSVVEPLVLLVHFGPGHPDMPASPE